jgi:hypothetical protein
LLLVSDKVSKVCNEPFGRRLGMLSTYFPNILTRLQTLEVASSDGPLMVGTGAVVPLVAGACVEVGPGLGVAAGGMLA